MILVLWRQLSNIFMFSSSKIGPNCAFSLGLYSKFLSVLVKNGTETMCGENRCVQGFTIGLMVIGLCR